MMNNTDLPDREKWDRIVEEAFSSNDDHAFSTHYDRKKKLIQRSVIMTKHRNIRKRITVAIVAAAVVTMLIPTTVYAYKKITARITKTANYQNTVNIQIPEESQDTQLTDTQQIAAEDEKYMNYVLEWLPEGYAEYGDNCKYENYQTRGGISPSFYKLPDDTNLDINLPYSISCENYETDGKTAMINYRAGYGERETDNFGREIIVSFQDTNYLLDIALTDDISKDDMIKIIDNIKLVPSDEKMYSDDISWLDQSANNMEVNNAEEESSPKIGIDFNDMCAVGDTISYNDFCDCFDITLNSAELTDSFDGIDTDQGGYETDFSELMDEKGNVAENIRKKIKYGDGINTIDEVVSEFVSPLHILKINVTFTNTKDETNDICISPTFFINKDGEPVDYWDCRYGYPYIDSLIQGKYSVCSFFSLKTSMENKGAKNHVILEPGESANVQIAYFIDDDCKDNVYIKFGSNCDALGKFFDVRN